MHPKNTSRRNVLKVAGLTTLAPGIAGCLGGSEDDGEYPNQSIRVIVPFGSGGGTDTNVRSFAPAWEDELGVELVVENMPGAAGREGSNHVARQDSDGYTLLANDPVNTLLGEVFHETEYTTAEFAKIGAPAGGFNALFAEPGRWENFDDFLSELDEGNEMNIATVGGVANNTGLISWSYFTELGISQDSFSTIPQDSGSQAAQAPASADADVGISVLSPSTAELVNEGTVDCLMVFNSDQSKLLPDVDSFETAGYDNLDPVPFSPAYMAPSGLSDDKQDTLVETYMNALDNDEYRTYADENGLEFLSYGPNDIEDVLNTWSPIAEEYANSV